MLFNALSVVALALSALAPSVAAVPTWGPPQPRGVVSISKLVEKMPKSTLPPPTGLQLKFVGLGIGTQNYTCSGSATAEPGTTGAIAKLYDLGSRLNTDPLAKWKISSISGLSLSMNSYPKMLEGYLAIQGYQRVLGDHFFTEATPTFSLNKVQSDPFPIAFVKRNASADAPPTACPGTSNEGAIPWLQLTDAGNCVGGVNTVYRLETAGGNKPKTCDGQDETFEVPYAAQYWVFGPK